MQNGNNGNDLPMITLRRWTVVAVVTRGGARTRHVWGHDIATDEGCVSETIMDFKMETMTITTATGRRYRLGGLPGRSKKAQPVWEEWCSQHGVVAQRDVTNDYMDPADVSTRQFVALNISAITGKPN